MTKEVRTVSAKEANVKNTPSVDRYYAIDNEGQIHWASSHEAALKAATAANQDLRENH